MSIVLEELDPGGRFVLEARDALLLWEETKREKGKKLNGDKKKDDDDEAAGVGVGVRV